MQIRAMYLHTMQRNRYDGSAQFQVIPQGNYDIHIPNNRNRMDCIGFIQPYQCGMPVLLEGSWDGRQFHVTSDQYDIKTRDGIDTMLSWVSNQNLGGNLTVHQIEKIIAACGNDLFRFFADDNCIPVLLDICKKSKNYEKVVQKLVNQIRQLMCQQTFVAKLQQYAIPYDCIDKMLRKSVTLEEIREDPYIVFSRFDVPISAADAFACQECGLEEYARPRCLGYVYAAIRYLISQGHSCITMQQLMDTVNGRYQKALNGTYFGPALINACILDLDQLCSYHTLNGTTYIYLNTIWAEESSALWHIKRLQNCSKKYKTDITVDDTIAETGIHYNAGQRAAFELLRTSGLKILTGPPGSGKTATINGLIHNFEANGNGTVRLAATTGIAARVMRDATNKDAQTANALLKVVPYDDVFLGRNLNDPVDADMIIVDEISMIGIKLFSVLVGAAQSDSIVLLVGDEHQLQSVEYGNVLHDLIDSGEVEVCRLTEIMRQSGTICTNAARVNEGIAQLDQDDTFQIKSVSDSSILQLLSSDYNPSKSQIITPTTKGPMGTFAINRMIQAHINSHSPVVAVYGKHEYRLSDKIIMTKNKYNAGYINGNIGYIRKAYENGDLLIDFDGGSIRITRSDYCNMDLAYAITIHKSQGSEFETVHIILPETGKRMMTRRLLYTAITRAKQRVIIYNQGNSLGNAIADRAETPRLTMLKNRLNNYIQER